MKPLSFHVLGIPKGQPRVKAFKRGKHAGVYDPGTADEWKLYVRAGFLKAFDEMAADATKPLFAGPVSVTLNFHLPRPKGHYRSNGELKPAAPFYHTGRPDSDNLAKAVLDALTNAGAWADDGIACVLWVSKTYGAQPGCMVKIEPLTTHITKAMETNA